MASKDIISLKEKEVLLCIACEAMIGGMSLREIQMLLRNRGADENLAISIYNQAKQTIENIVLKDIEEVVSVHIQLYEHIYKRMLVLGFQGGKLKALRQKEKIIGLHKEENFIEINNEVNLTIEEQTDYDLSALSSGELKRYNDLYSKIASGRSVKRT